MAPDGSTAHVVGRRNKPQTTACLDHDLQTETFHRNLDYAPLPTPRHIWKELPDYSLRFVGGKQQLSCHSNIGSDVSMAALLGIPQQYIVPATHSSIDPQIVYDINPAFIVLSTASIKRRVPRFPLAGSINACMSAQNHP